MANAFKRTRAGIVASFDPTERDLLIRLFLDVADMLEDGLPGDGDPLDAMVGIAADARQPDDPALARLLPTASRDDAELAGEFRRYTEIGLRQRKSANLRVAAASLTQPDTSGDDVRLDSETATAWLTALTDVRLVLAERLGIQTDSDAEALHDMVEQNEDDDPRSWLAAVYDFLTWVQETLVGALTR